MKSHPCGTKTDRGKQGDSSEGEREKRLEKSDEKPPLRDKNRQGKQRRFKAIPAGQKPTGKAEQFKATPAGQKPTGEKQSDSREGEREKRLGKSDEKPPLRDKNRQGKSRAIRGKEKGKRDWGKAVVFVPKGW